jgi:hypothetical protein
MEERESLKTELTELLTEKRELKSRLARLERDRLAARLEKIDAELAHESDSAADAAEIDKEVQRLMKSAQGKKARRKPQPKPDGKPKPEGDRPQVEDKVPAKDDAAADGSGKTPSADDPAADTSERPSAKGDR